MMSFNYLKNAVVNSAILISDKLSYMFHEIVHPAFNNLVKFLLLPVTLFNRGLEYLLISLTQSERFNIFGLKIHHVHNIMAATIVFQYCLAVFFSLDPVLILFNLILGETIASLAVSIIVWHVCIVKSIRTSMLDSLQSLSSRILLYTNSIPISQNIPGGDFEKKNGQRLSKALNKSLENNDVKATIDILREYYNSADVGSNRYLWSPLMEQLYEDSNNNKIGPWRGLSEDVLRNIEEEYKNKDIICDMMMCLKKIPVIVSVPGYEYKYKADFMTLIKQLHASKGLIRQHYRLSSIQYSHIKPDNATYNLILKIAAKARDMQDTKFYSTFDVVTQRAMVGNDFAPVLLKLKTNEQKYDSDIRSVPWNKHMQQAYDSFLKNSKTADEHSQQYKCGITLKTMQNPVYIKDRKGAKHYFELLALFHWIKENDNMPLYQEGEEAQDLLNASNEYLLSQIIYDVDMKATIDQNTPILVAKPPLQFSTSRTVSADNDSYFSRARSSVSRITSNFRKIHGF